MYLSYVMMGIYYLDFEILDFLDMISVDIRFSNIYLRKFLSKFIPHGI